MKTLETMLAYEHNYLESAGRYDKQHLRQAFADKGAGTVLRLCIWRHRKQHAAPGAHLCTQRR